MTTFHGPAARLMLPLLALFLLSARSVSGCSCHETTDLYKIESADLIFIGRVVLIQDLNAGASIRSSMDPVVYTFEIERLYKGEQTTEVQVLSASGGASCGMTFQNGSRHLVLAHGSKGEFGTSICSGGERIDQAGSLIATLDSLNFPTSPLEWDRKLVFDAVQKISTAPTEEERAQAIYRLGWLEKLPTLSLATLGKWATSGTEKEKIAAIQSLYGFRDFGYRTRPLFVTAINDSSEAVQQAAMSGLSGVILGRNETETLKGILVHHRNAKVRIAAANLLAARQSRTIGDDRDWRFLTPALQDSVPEVRMAAANAIGSFGVDARVAYDSLATLLDDAESSVRVTGVKSLWKVAPDRARPVIESSLSGKDSTMRATCIDLAVTYELGNRRDILRAAVRDPAPMVREKGWEIWRGWHDAPLDTVLVFQAMADEFVRVRLAVMSCLSNRNEIRDGLAEVPEYQALLRGLTRDPSFFVRQDVIHLILMSDLSQALQSELLVLAKDSHPSVRGNAINALGRVPRSPEIQAVLERALKDESELVRNYADMILNGCR